MYYENNIGHITYKFETISKFIINFVGSLFLKFNLNCIFLT